jgi:hypothetical protein
MTLSKGDTSLWDVSPIYKTIIDHRGTPVYIILSSAKEIDDDCYYNTQQYAGCNGEVKSIIFPLDKNISGKLTNKRYTGVPEKKQ